MDTQSVECDPQIDQSTGVKTVRNKAIECHCNRCHYEWETHDLGDGHQYPRRCANVKCRSQYWDKARKEWSSLNFDISSIQCEECYKSCAVWRRSKNLPLIGKPNNLTHQSNT